jgi:hypothetical protein
MKKIKVFGIIVIMMIIGLLMMACPMKPEHTHDFSGEWEKDEVNHWKECAEGGEKAQIIAHAFDDWETVTEATKDAAGSKRRECTECEYVDTDIIPKLIILGYEMEDIQGGLFIKGGLSNVQVTLSNFSIGKYEVTQAQYKAVMGIVPGGLDGDNLPVDSARWYEAIVFCNTLSMKEGLEPAYSKDGETDPKEWGAVPMTGNDATWDAVECNFDANGYRLPTEAEWEYAARGGQKSNGYEYAGSDDPNEVAWYFNNSGSTIHNVGTKKANELGLYDMSGNVEEWCWDWYGSDPSGKLEDDYAGVASGEDRVLRGGDWFSPASHLQFYYRDHVSPYDWSGTPGFRLVHSL